MRALVLTSCFLLTIARLHGADALSTWHLRHVTGLNTLRLQSLAFGNGVFVAPVWNLTPGATTVLRSVDGVNWTRYLPSGGLSPNSVIFANGHFYSGSAVSSDGIVWTNITGNLPSKLVSNGNLCVGISSSSVFVSTNGFQWSVAMPFESNIQLEDIGYGAGVFVIVGLEKVQDLNYGMLLTSQDGLGWTFRRQLRREFPRTVTYGNGRFVVPLGNGTNLISTDGFVWDEVPTGFSPWKFLGGLFFGSLGGTNYSTSPDGISFTTHTFGTNGGALVYDVAFGSGTFVAVVYNGVGEIWQSDPLTNLPPTAPTLAVASYPGLTITGTVGTQYRLEYRDALAANQAWTALTNVVLPSSPWRYFDQDGFVPSKRFYRAVAE